MRITDKQVEQAILEKHDGDVYDALEFGIRIYNQNIAAMIMNAKRNNKSELDRHLEYAIKNIKILQQIIDVGNSHTLKNGKIIK